MVQPVLRRAGCPHILAVGGPPGGCSGLFAPMNLRILNGGLRRVFANLRAQRRRPDHGPVVISWRDAGRLMSIPGTCRDISVDGIGVVCGRPLASGRAVYVHKAGAGRLRTASARYSRQDGSRFVVGFEYTPECDLEVVRRAD